MNKWDHDDSKLQYEHRHLQLALIISVSLTLILLLAACPLSAVAIQQRVIPPLTFTARLGRVEISAPCPPRELVCDESTPFYAVWRGDLQPDGTILYRELFFMYLRPPRRP